MQTHLLNTNSGPTRRGFLLAGVSALVAGLAWPRAALALNEREAEALVDRVVADINATIGAGRSESWMIGQFEQIFANYANVPAIAQQVLGPLARAASASQMRRYTSAFQGYVARKYGKRFREFIGGQVTVQGATARRSYYEVKTVARLQGRPPFNVSFRVAEFGGRSLFFDMLIEGISLIKSEREEMNALLEQRRRNLDQLIADLPRLG
jgi:phospholipid transport system substrate-binding protein